MSLFFRRKMLFPLRAAILCVVASVMCVACSPKKNTAASRNYQAFITRYNIYYNGDEHFRETLRAMELKYEDDYSQRLFIHPAEARAHPRSPQPEGNFDRSIEKAQKAIQLRSIKKRPKRPAGRQTDETRAWMRRSEYNPFLHNAWLMMGRSQFYNGDFAGAAATMHYIDRQFSWLPDVTLDARLWQARSYVAMDWLFEAEQILRLIKPEDLTNKRLKEGYALAMADMMVSSKRYEEAIPFILDAIKYAKGTQKPRLNFLLGQIYTLTDKPSEAYDAFGRAAGSAYASYRTKFNARIKQSEVYQGENIEPEVRALKRMTRYDRNREYLDQIYYAIGNLYLSRRDTTNAIANYELAAEKSTRNGIEKAISQLTLGGLYFDLHRYDKAQPCYSEAVPQLPDDYPNYALLKRRSDVLDELAVYSGNVTLQDSLLRLAAMPEEQRLAVIDRIIVDLKRAEREAAEEARRAEYEAQSQSAGTGLNTNNANAPATFTLNTDDSWYFYNTSVRNAGKADFQRRWGSRKLEDDWRRRNRASFSFSDFDAEEDEEDDLDDIDLENDSVPEVSPEQAAREADPHFPEYYLRQIPSTPDEIATSNDIIQEGLYNMGVILKNKLQDVGSAAAEFNTLLERYPDNIYRLDTYYNMYLMYMQAGQTQQAEQWRQVILDEFPDSRYAVAMADPHYLDKLRRMEAMQDSLYRATYDDYIANRNENVHEAYASMMREYPLSKLMPQFMFLHALAYVTENKPEEFNATLREMLDRYPETPMTPMASSWLREMASGRKLNSDASSNTRGMLWDIRLTNDSATVATDSLDFKWDTASPHSLILIFDRNDIEPNSLLFNVARYNFNTFLTVDFDLETHNFGSLSLLVIKGFNNLVDVAKYRKSLLSTLNLSSNTEVQPLAISDDNFRLMLERGATFEDYFRFLERESINAVHEGVLPPEEYPDADETREIISEQLAPPSENQTVTAPSEPSQPDDTEVLIEQETEVVTQPESEPEYVPVPEPEPVAAPTPQPTPMPAPEPENAPEPEPITTSTPQPAPAPVPIPSQRPTPVPVPLGSEGDDPLLDD